MGCIASTSSRMEKVKFDVSLKQVCKQGGGLPGPLLLMLIKMNKEGPYKKGIFRTPGHQDSVRKLIRLLKKGPSPGPLLKLIHSVSVNTIASVLKQFLLRIPGGIFGKANEDLLFDSMNTDQGQVQLKLVVLQKVFRSLPVDTQHLLILLIGTFHVIHAEQGRTGMSAEALGISVAPSFFHTCCGGDQEIVTCFEDIQKFKLATMIMTFFITNFDMLCPLFGPGTYEYYMRTIGQIDEVEVEDEWIFFSYPAPTTNSGTQFLRIENSFE